ncbi:DUF6333 family protein [Streptomyces platensis]
MGYTEADTYDGAWVDHPDLVRAWRGSTTLLTLSFPPFREPAAAAGPWAPEPHDPVRARRVVESLGTVDGVLEELPARRTADLEDPEMRADLDYVAVGCWGGIVWISDPALGDYGMGCGMDQEVGVQRALHPEARIVGTMSMDYGLTYRQHVVDLPGGHQLDVSGWIDAEGLEVTGDPEEMLRVIGIDPASVRDRYTDPDEPDNIDWCDWDCYTDFFVGGFADTDPSTHQGLWASLFRVRRSESAQGDLAEVWLGK